MNVNWLRDRTRLMGEKIAIIDPSKNTQYTYNQLYDRAQKLAVYFQDQGIQHGDRVALYSQNDISYFDILFATTLLGAIFVPLNWRLSQNELNHVIQDSEPKLIMYSNLLDKSNLSESVNSRLGINVDEIEYDQAIETQAIDKLNEVKVDQEDISLFIYTSGTTGMPKGAMISHRHIISNGLYTIPSWQISQYDRTITFSPLFHVAGLSALVLPLLMAGGQIIIENNFKKQRALDYVKKFEPTVLFMVPTMYYDVVKLDDFTKETLKSVRFFVSGGAPMSKAVYEAFAELRLPLIDSYGLTEAGSNNFFMDPTIANNHRGSVGKPLMFIDTYVADDDGNPVKAGEIGELLIAGETVFSGYWNKPERTKKSFHNEYVKTGDLARVDEDGHYYIVGRKKDMIITGGENVYPTEVEKVINMHEIVSDSAVFGYPDEKWGESVAVALILNKEVENIESVLDGFAREKLAVYKVPKAYLIVDEFPKTSVGKVKKSKLTELILEQLES